MVAAIVRSMLGVMLTGWALSLATAALGFYVWGNAPNDSVAARGMAAGILYVLSSPGIVLPVILRTVKRDARKYSGYVLGGLAGSANFLWLLCVCSLVATWNPFAKSLGAAVGFWIMVVLMMLVCAGCSALLLTLLPTRLSRSAGGEALKDSPGRGEESNR